MRTLEAYRPVMEPILNMCAERTEFSCEPSLSEIFFKHKKLIAIFNHSAPLSWIPVAAMITKVACEAGGGGRRPMGVLDRFFFKMPVLRPVARYLAQGSRSPDFSELVRRFAEEDNLDLALFPEGSNCFFGPPEEIQPFRSNRFVELAIRTDTPLLICVHRGSEHWGQVVRIRAGQSDIAQRLIALISPQLQKSGVLTVPTWPGRMPVFRMTCELYHPTLKLADVDALTPARRNRALSEEARKVRQRMREMFAYLAH